VKTVGILGSARKGGNTEVLLDAALQEARRMGGSTSKIALRDKVIAPCDGCMGCARTGKCVIRDDMQEVYKEILEADGVIWASPVYFWSMSGLTKNALDRTYALTFPKLQQAGKIAGLIIVAASRGCVSASNPFHMYFSYNHMFAAEFTMAWAQEKGKIKKDAMAVTMAKMMVRQMHALFAANLSYPKEEFSRPLRNLVRDKLGS
jgi:multimeric flavodoxin WrbA